MLDYPNADPIYITTQKSLTLMLGELEKHAILAVDTESNSLYVYKEQVCLIQFSTGSEDYIVDPLSNLDLSILGTVFADVNIEKVFHAAEYDLICLKRDFGFEFNNVFDTMLAARILGRKNVGLASMLASEFNIKIQKKYQRANWGKRPLIPEMLNYARLDTSFLINLRNQLRQELQDKRLLTLAEEDFKRTTSVIPPNGENDNANCWRVAGNKKMTPTQTSALQALCRFRDKHARQANLPPFKVLGNNTLLDIALMLPKTYRDLQFVKSLNPAKIQRYGEGLLKAIHHGQENPPANRPARVRPSEPFMERIEYLRKWRLKTAKELGVESDVVLPRDVMERIAGLNPEDLPHLAEVMQDSPWRFRKYGEQILYEISKKGIRI